MIIIFIVKVLLEPSKNITALPGDTIMFQCTAVAEKIDFFVNGIRADDSRNSEKGLTLGSVHSLNDTSVSRYLTVEVSVSSNKSLIVCRGTSSISSNKFLSDSDSVVLLVQGIKNEASRGIPRGIRAWPCMAWQANAPAGLYCTTILSELYVPYLID